MAAGCVGAEAVGGGEGGGGGGGGSGTPILQQSESVDGLIQGFRRLGVVQGRARGSSGGGRGGRGRGREGGGVGLAHTLTDTKPKEGKG